MPKKVLAVDDSRSVRKLVEFTLKDRGFEVTTAEDGQEGLELLLKEQFDAVILDINMPRLDGFELLKKIRASDATVSIPVVMLTTEGQEADKEQAMMLGATAYIVKPFKPTSLLKVMEEIVAG